MPMSQTDLLDLTDDVLLPAFRAERIRLNEIDKWLRWENAELTIPRGATAELRSLLQLSKTPWLPLVVTTSGQALSMNGYRSPESSDDLPPYRLWQINDMDLRSSAVYRAALGYGVAYTTVLPSTFADAPSAAIRGVSPRKMLAFYASPAEDDWPLYAIRVEANGAFETVRVYDDECVYFLTTENPNGDGLRYVDTRAHDVGVCPVVRYTNMLDLEGRTTGEVEPFISLAKRIDKTTYDRLLIQHFNSWKVRTVAGMAEPDTDEAANRAKLQLRHDDILIAEDPDTKFGVLAETSMDGMIKAGEADKGELAATSQTPVFALTGDLVNVSTDTIAAAWSAFNAKTNDHKRSFGKSDTQTLRLASQIAGDIESANDPMAHTTWADTSIQTLAGAADALGKIATMLGVPVEALWPRIPGTSKTDVEEWKVMRDQGDPIAQALKDVAAGMTSV
jgi:hypothetical protein